MKTLEPTKAIKTLMRRRYMYTFGGRQKGDNKLYTFTSRPVHLLAASYLLLSPIHVRSALQAGMQQERREKRECPSVSSR